jgi:predicted lipoprotein with Yx(FWY)xxD motif
MPRPRSLLVLAMSLALAALVAGCGSSGSSSGGGGSPSATQAAGVQIHTKSVLVGGTQVTVLADASGKTLYYFVPDSATQVACTGGCAQVWPPLLSPGGTPTSATSLPAALGVLNGANGPQVTYNGHPLYTYTQDHDTGDAHGEGVAGKWHVATPSLAPLSTGTPTSGYGYGYGG